MPEDEMVNINLKYFNYNDIWKYSNASHMYLLYPFAVCNVDIIDT